VLYPALPGGKGGKQLGQLHSTHTHEHACKRESYHMCVRECVRMLVPMSLHASVHGPSRACSRHVHYYQIPNLCSHGVEPLLRYRAQLAYSKLGSFGWSALTAWTGIVPCGAEPTTRCGSHFFTLRNVDVLLGRMHMHAWALRRRCACPQSTATPHPCHVQRHAAAVTRAGERHAPALRATATHRQGIAAGLLHPAPAHHDDAQLNGVDFASVRRLPAPVPPADA